MAKVHEKHSLLKSAVALLLILLCLVAANWQYNRGVDRHARNAVIENRISLPEIELTKILDSPRDYEWQSVNAIGTFDTSQQILLRNRYSEGIYGLEVLTLFNAVTGEKFWVDRGWVKAGATATTPPIVSALPATQVKIQGRLRLDSSLPRGAFFALPANGSGLISKLNAQSQLETRNFYLDLLEGSEPILTPAVPAALPELTDGPHMAYALQWLFFAGLVIYGRFLIRRSS